MELNPLRSIDSAIINPLSDVQSGQIGEGTIISQYVVILKEAVIGTNCRISAHAFIENDVIVGNNVTLKSGVYLWDGVRIEDNVFVGPSVVFTNDSRPRSKDYKAYGSITIKKGASLGASTSIIPGVTVGEYAVTGMGSVVTKDVPAHALVFGNPARIQGWVDKKGANLLPLMKDLWQDDEGNNYSTASGNLVPLIRETTDKPVYSTHMIPVVNNHRKNYSRMVAKK